MARISINAMVAYILLVVLLIGLMLAIAHYLVVYCNSKKSANKPPNDIELDNASSNNNSQVAATTSH